MSAKEGDVVGTNGSDVETVDDVLFDDVLVDRGGLGSGDVDTPPDPPQAVMVRATGTTSVSTARTCRRKIMVEA